MLTATISHEMKNPLNAILSMHNVLEGFIKKEDGRRILKVSKNSCVYMLYLIHDMTDYFNIKAGVFEHKK